MMSFYNWYIKFNVESKHILFFRKVLIEMKTIMENDFVSLFLSTKREKKLLRRRENLKQRKKH